MKVNIGQQRIYYLELVIYPLGNHLTNWVNHLILEYILFKLSEHIWSYLISKNSGKIWDLFISKEIMILKT